MAFGEPITLKTIGTRDEFGMNLVDNEVDRNLATAQYLQNFILKNNLLADDAESQNLLRKYLNQIDLSEGIFSDLNASAVLGYTTLNNIIFMAKRNVVPTREFGKLFGQIVFKLKHDLAPKIYASYGFSPGQVMDLMADAERVKMRYPTLAEGVLIVGDPSIHAPPKVVKAEIIPITPLPLFAEEGISDTLHSLEEDIFKVD